MTLDDVIMEYKQNAIDYEHAMCDGDYSSQQREYAQDKWEYYSQLVDWLEELRYCRDSDNLALMVDLTKMKGIKKLLKEQYLKAISDFTKAIVDICSCKANLCEPDYICTECSDFTVELRHIRELAKKLKEERGAE